MALAAGLTRAAGHSSFRLPSQSCMEGPLQKSGQPLFQDCVCTGLFAFTQIRVFSESNFSVGEILLDEKSSGDNLNITWFLLCFMSWIAVVFLSVAAALFFHKDFSW